MGSMPTWELQDFLWLGNMVRKRFNHGMPFPGALPFTSFGTNRISINVTYIPKLIPDMVPLWFFQLKVRI
ncbi:MAG: hypothetical protein D6732_05870 [Methanobacteriota archaeon]|nr:MAG: hypothetical protein D6732_05870 [Euryarchaeota archaeon]